MNKKIKLSILASLLATTSLSIVMPIVSCSAASEALTFTKEDSAEKPFIDIVKKSMGLSSEAILVTSEQLTIINNVVYDSNDTEIWAAAMNLYTSNSDTIKLKDVVREFKISSTSTPSTLNEEIHLNITFTLKDNYNPNLLGTLNMYLGRFTDGSITIVDVEQVPQSQDIYNGIGNMLRIITSENPLEENTAPITSELFAKMINANDLTSADDVYNGSKIIDRTSNPAGFGTILTFFQDSSMFKVNNKENNEPIALASAIKSFEITSSKAWELPRFGVADSATGDVLFNMKVNLNENYIIDEASVNNLNVNELKVGIQGKTMFQMFTPSITNADLAIETWNAMGNPTGTSESRITEEIFNNIPRKDGENSDFDTILTNKVFDLKFGGISTSVLDKENEETSLFGLHPFVEFGPETHPGSIEWGPFEVNRPLMVDLSFTLSQKIKQPNLGASRTFWNKTNLLEILGGSDEKFVFYAKYFQIGRQS